MAQAEPKQLEEEVMVPHLKLKASMISPLVLVVGDPARAKFASTLLEGGKRVAKNREYYTYVGKWKGKLVTITSHGVGGGGASVCFEELIHAGAKVILRAGTCGSLNPDYRDGTYIAASGAVREDGVTNNLVPLSYPAVSDWRVTKSIVNSLEKHNVKFGEGIIVTEGPFYGGVLEGRNELWQRAKVFAVEMEISVLFVIASLRGIRAGAVLTVDNYIFERLKGSQYAPEKVAERVRKMCEISLDALIDVEL